MEHEVNLYGLPYVVEVALGLPAADRELLIKVLHADAAGGDDVANAMVDHRYDAHRYLTHTWKPDDEMARRSTIRQRAEGLTPTYDHIKRLGRLYDSQPQPRQPIFEPVVPRVWAMFALIVLAVSGVVGWVCYGLGAADERDAGARTEQKFDQDHPFHNNPGGIR